MSRRPLRSGRAWYRLPVLRDGRGFNGEGRGELMPAQERATPGGIA